MKKEIIAYIIGILGCIIIDAGLVAMVVAFGASRPFYDYIIFGIFILFEDFDICFENSENKYLVIKLPKAIDDNSLLKLKWK